VESGRRHPSVSDLRILLSIMALKKSDLYSSIWASCDALRGGMDASQYKDYVLFLLFIKYITDKYGNSDDFAPAVVIPKGASFKDMIALKGKSDIGDRINKEVIAPLVNANSQLARTDFPDFNDSNKLGEGKEKVERLTNLIAIFQKQELDFSKNRAEHDDILGDAYEYLMRHFASESGKSKGQFYTPSEVSRIIAKVIGIGPHNTKGKTSAYDPTCGSGSLLLKVAAEAGRRITLEGQEKDVTTAGLARMNMILHGFPDATILSGNTLADPKFKDGENLRAYDYVVANPPFSDKAWLTGLTPATDPYQRFAWGEPPGKQGDYAYLLHILRSMKATGKGACILPHGVLFRGNAEAVIRTHLVRSGILKGIIGLPANLFYGTGIPACILVLDKENATARKGIFMVDASKGFAKDGPKNRLRERDIHKIVDVFDRQDERDARYARLVPHDEIAKNDFNLNLPRYIDSSEPEDLQNIAGHLYGGIPNRDIDAFAADWQEYPGVRKALFKRGERPCYSALRVPAADIAATIRQHPEFTTYRDKAVARFDQWKKAFRPKLVGFGQGDHPKELAHLIGEGLLLTMQSVSILDPYAIYQHLTDYWAATMQDDCYLISGDGWVAEPTRIIETGKNGKVKDKGWICDLVPKSLIVARYYAKQQAAIETLQAEQEAAAASLTELEEEHGGEEGVLGQLEKIAKGEINARLKEIKNDKGAKDEAAILRQWLQLHTTEVETKKAIRDAEAALDQMAYDHYAKLTPKEIHKLVVDDKWLATLTTAVHGELDRISQILTARIRTLAERYATPLPEIEAELAALSAKVEAHLKKMEEADQTRFPGYKEKWETKSFGDLFTFSGGYSASRNDLSAAGYCYLHYGDIHTSTRTTIDTDSDFDRIPKLDIPLNRITSTSLLNDGDVVFVDASEDNDGISKHVVVANRKQKPFISGLHTIVAKAKTDEIVPAYRRFCFQSQPIKEQFKFYSVGTKVSGISKSNISKLTLPVPSRDEQTAIAAVLSDMDAEIAALEARREKIQALKQGMMQELLTGRTRLV